MKHTNLDTYNRYNDTQLTAMGEVYYSGKANTYQTAKYELVCDLLYSELLQLNPKAKRGAAVYMWHAIGAALRNANANEKVILDQMRANMQTATNQLANWK